MVTPLGRPLVGAIDGHELPAPIRVPHAGKHAGQVALEELRRLDMTMPIGRAPIRHGGGDKELTIAATFHVVPPWMPARRAAQDSLKSISYSVKEHARVPPFQGGRT